MTVNYLYQVLCLDPQLLHRENDGSHFGVVFMQHLRSFFMLVFTLLVLVLCILLVLQNPAVVQVSLFNFESAEISLGVLLILVFATGAFFAVLMNLTWYTRVLLKQRRLNKALQQSLKRVEHIRQP